MESVSTGRRSVLATICAVCASGWAGCLSGSGTDGGTSAGGDASDVDDGESDGNGETNRYDFTVEHPVEEPVAIDESHRCMVCAMTVAEFPERNGQVAHENNVGALLCSPGCLFAYTVDPPHFDGPDAEIVGVWVIDFETGEQIDGTEAHYVLEHDEERTDDPMGLDPRPYHDRTGAITYVEAYDDLGEDDVVRFEDVDIEVARIYRGRRLP